MFQFLHISHYSHRQTIFIRFKDLQRSHKFDIIFIQREALLIGSSYFEKKFFKKNKVIFDFDDSIWLHDTSEGNKKFKAFFFFNVLTSTFS